MKVRITETLSRVIEAESVADKYAASEIVLDADDFVCFAITEEKGEEHGDNADIQEP
ncbi:unknown [Firmicutes bacterium CAG:238]|nr:unknown [Firmicutes bacterium CAG:238]